MRSLSLRFDDEPRAQSQQYANRADERGTQHENLHKRILMFQDGLDVRDFGGIALVVFQRAVDVDAAAADAQRRHRLHRLPTALHRVAGHHREPGFLERVPQLARVVQLPIRAYLRGSDVSYGLLRRRHRREWGISLSFQSLE